MRLPSLRGPAPALFAGLLAGLLPCFLLAACRSDGPRHTVAAAADDLAAQLRAERLPDAVVAEDLRLLAQARAAFPWCDATPPEIFRDAVVPHTFLDEDIRPWRAKLFRRFAPVARGCATRREAILAIAREAAKATGARYDTRRRAANQCAAETLESGMASCSGLSILLAGAYRSVGIPARIAGVAQWGDRPGNHTWVEVWDDDGWHMTEFYPDKDGLDRGWVPPACVWQNPAIPEQRVLARSSAGRDRFRLPWNPGDLSLPAEDRTAFYQALGGGRKLPDGAPVLAVESRDAKGRRTVVAFEAEVDGKPLACGETPGPTMDLNHTPRLTATAGRPVLFRWTTADGREKTKRYTPTAEGNQVVLLEAE